MRHTVERLEVRCRADRAEAGSQAERRLVRIAHYHLPQALDVVLPDADITLGRLSVPLRFAIDDYDDETVAWRWAAEIDAAVRSSLGGSAADQPGRPMVAATAEGAPETAPPSAVDAADSSPPSTDAPAPTAAAADEVGRRAIVGALERVATGRRRAILRAMRRMLAAPREPGSQTESAGAARSRRLARAAALDMATGAERDVHRLDDLAWSRLLARMAAAINTSGLRSIADAERVPVDVPSVPAPALEAEATESSLVTYVGGLVFLYPWLGSYLELSDRSVGTELESRLAALTALLGAAEVRPQDPLLMVLAGADPGTRVDVPQVAATDTAELEEAIDEIYAAFVSMLPGAWSARVLTTDLLIRHGQLEREADMWTLTLQPRPLDLVARSVPYPLTSFRLPWMDSMIVRWLDG